VKNAPYLVHGCGRVPFPHLERFWNSQPREPDPTDLVPPEAVVEEHDGVFINSLRLRGKSSIYSLENGEID
jgi:hypothetical protein